MLLRFYDAFGRDEGYALNGVHQSMLGYDPSTGRLATMLIPSIEDFNHHSPTPTLNSNSFTWNYLDGSDLKSSLTYPNGLTASWTYGNRGELLEVNNASPTGTISKYAYTYDAAGRRVACAKSGTAFEQSDSVNYGYNTRSELTSATAAVDSDYRYGYNFDDIGNRKTSSERGTNSVYTASQLNQYTAVNDFTPTYDADGNQTVVKTATGIWQIIYNGENRPVRWENGDSVITMSYDRMGRRVTKNDQLFVYNGYLQICNYNSSTSTSHFNYYIWDPTEPVATRPLAWKRGTSVAYYTHDGNKNVSEVIASNNDVAAHYEYAPFGALTVSRGTSAAANPWRFSSEYAEDDTATVYYNYRHYEPVTGRWLSRDPIEELGNMNLYACIKLVNGFDRMGLKECVVGKIEPDQSGWKCKGIRFSWDEYFNGFVIIRDIVTTWELTADVECCCFQWNWSWGKKCRKVKNTITKSVEKSMLLNWEVDFSFGKTLNGPTPLPGVAVFGEAAALLLSKAISEIGVLLPPEEAEKLAAYAASLKPTSLNEGVWPANKCD